MIQRKVQNHASHGNKKFKYKQFGNCRRFFINYIYPQYILIISQIFTGFDENLQFKLKWEKQITMYRSKKHNNQQYCNTVVNMNVRKTHELVISKVQELKTNQFNLKS